MKIVRLAATLVLVSCTAAPLVQAPSQPPSAPLSGELVGPLPLAGAVPSQLRLPQEALIDSVQGQLRSAGNQDSLRLRVLIRRPAPAAGFRTQQLELERIRHLRAWVIGQGIPETLYNLNNYVPVDAEDTNLEISQVPRGLLRVVTVQGYEAVSGDSYPALPGATLKAVYSSPENSTDVELVFTWRSTALAAVVESLLKSAETNPDLTPLLENLDLPALQTLVDALIYGDEHPVGGSVYQHHPAQLDPDALAAEIMTQQGAVPTHTPGEPVPSTWLKSLADVALVVRTPHNTPFGNSDIRIQMTDPASAPFLIRNTDTALLPEIIPGTWEAIVHIDGLNGGVSARTTVTVDANGAVTLAEGTSANPVVLPPVLKSLSLAEAAAGTEITIEGDGFDPNQPTNNQVRFGVTPATVLLATETSLRVVVPPGVEAAQAISVTAHGKTSNLADFTIPRQITRLDRNGALEGQEVTIYLSGYDPTQDPGFGVSFTGGVTAVPVSGGVTAGTITVVVPVGAQTGPITVTPTTGAALVSPILTINVPALNQVGPNSGSPGDTVVLTGVNLQGATGVTFNGVNVPSEDIQIIDDTTIEVKVPVGATTGPVVVTTPQGNATSPEDFAVTGSITSLSNYGGTPGVSVVDIHVSGVVLNSGNPPDVRFYGPSGPISAGNITVIDGDTVRVTVPNGASTGPVTLTPPGGGTPLTGPTYYINQPGLISVSNTNSQVIQSGLPNQQVVLAGANLDTATEVCFGSVCTSTFTKSSNAIVVVIPAGAVSGPVEVRTPQGNASLPFGIMMPPVITGLTPPDPAASSPSLVLEGAHYLPVTQVTIGGQIIPPSDYTIHSDSSLTVHVLPDTPVLGVITVTNPAGTAVTSLTYKNVVNFLGSASDPGVAGSAPNTIQNTPHLCPHGVNVDSSGQIYAANITCVGDFYNDGVDSTAYPGSTYAVRSRNTYGSNIHKFAANGSLQWVTGSNAFSRKESYLYYNGGYYYYPGGVPKYTDLSVKQGRSGYVDGLIADALFNEPEDIANDAAGNLYVADTANHAIRKIITSGPDAGQVKTLARVPGPEGIEIDRQGRLFVTSNYPPNPTSIVATNKAYVLRIDDLATLPPNLATQTYNPDDADENLRWSSNVSKVAGGNIVLSAQTGIVQPLSNVRFKHLEGLGIDGNGHVYVADVDNYQVRKLDIDNDQATVFASVGASSPTNTTPNIYMHEIRVDRLGHIFVPSATAGPAVGVYLITPQGKINLIAGGATTGLQDGNPLTQASFTSPRAVDFGPDGSLYVADTAWGIRKIERYYPVTNLQMP